MSDMQDLSPPPEPGAAQPAASTTPPSPAGGGADAGPSPAPVSTEILQTYFKHLFWNSRDVMNLFSLTQQKIILMNPAAIEASGGYSGDELAKIPLDKIYPPEELPKLAEAFDRLVRQGYTSDKLRIYTKTGELRDVWIRSYIIQQEPEVVCLVHSIDITEERRREEKAIQEAKLATLGEFSAMLAHELVNSLQVMQFGLQVLQMDKGSTLSEKAAEQTRRMRRAIANMDSIIRNVQKYARPSSGAARASATSLATVIEDATQILEAYLRVKNVEMAIEVEKDLPIVIADANHIQHILLILIKNAAQAMLDKTLRRIRIAAYRHEGTVRVEVQDIGGGIPAEIVARIFDAFATTKPTGIGVGLGLSIARKMAVANNVDMRFESRPGDGTTFFLTFASPETAPGREQASSPTPVPLAKTALLVRESAPIAMAMTQTLTASGVRLLQASTGAEAVRLLHAQTIDMIYCEQSMFPVSGAELAKEFRKTFRGPICLIVAPGATVDEGAFDFLLVEPLSPEKIGQVQQEMEKHDPVAALVKDIVPK